MGRRGGPILILVGVLQLALGAGLAIGLGGIPYAGPGMIGTGVILGLVGVALILGGLWWWRSAAGLDRISATGVAGTGLVTGLTQTGMMVNQQPVVGIDLLVSIPGRPPYAATVREPVPLILLNRLQGSLPVRVDPARPDRVVIQWDQLAAPGIPVGFGAAAYPGTVTVPGPAGPGSGTDETLGQVAAAMTTPGVAPVYADPGQAGISVEQLRAHLRATGLGGTARIDQLQDSGTTIGDERLLTMTTTIFLPDRIPFTSGPSAAMVPLEKLPRIAVGVELPVKVAPDNDHLVMFEWDRI
jgi:hypothetical protein